MIIVAGITSIEIESRIKIEIQHSVLQFDQLYYYFLQYLQDMHFGREEDSKGSIRLIVPSNHPQLAWSNWSDHKRVRYRTRANLVVGDRVEEVVVARVQAGVHHAAGDTKHGGTSVLDLDVEGTVTGLRVFDLARVSSRDGSGGSVVTSRKILGSSGVLSGRHGDGLGNSSEKKDLDKSEGRDGGKGRESHSVVKDGGERNFSLKVKGSREGDAKFLDHHTDEGSHGDTSVLDFDGTTTGEGVGILSKSKRIEKVKRTRVDSKTIRGAGISVDGGGSACLLGRGEGGGRGGKGGKDGELHVDSF